MMHLGSLFADFTCWVHQFVHTGLYLQLGNILLHYIFHFSSASFVVDSILRILIIYMCSSFSVCQIFHLRPYCLNFFHICFLCYWLDILKLDFYSSLPTEWLCFHYCILSFLAILSFWMHPPFHLIVLIAPSCDFLFLCLRSQASCTLLKKVNSFLNFSSEFCSISLLEACSSSGCTEWYSYSCGMWCFPL